MKPKRVLSLLLCIMIAVMQVPAIVSAEEAAPVWDGSIDTSWYDTNPAASEYTISGGKVNLPTNPSDGTGKYFFGWYTDNDTCSKAFDQTTVVNEDTTLYANFGTRIIAISDYTAFYTGDAVEYAGTVKDNANSVPNVTDLTYTYYTDSAGTVKTTEADNGAAFEGAAPAKTGTYYVRAAAAEDTANHIDAAASNLAKMIVTNATIASINPVEDVEVEFDTSEAAIYYWYLASETTIIDSNGQEYTVDLDWTIDGYNENIAGVYMATGTFTLPETVVQSTPPIALQVTAKITVWPAIDATISPTTVVFDLDNPVDVRTFINLGSAGYATDVVHDSIYLEEGADWEEAGYWEEDEYWEKIWRPLIIIYEEYLSGLGMESGDVVEFEIFFDIGDKAVLKVEAVEDYTPGSNAFLGSLRVNNTSVADFVYGKFDYDIKLPHGTLPYNPVAIVGATSVDPKATVVIEQAYELPGVATVLVTAEDGIATQTYTVTLTVADSPEYALTITAGSGGSITLGSSEAYEEGAVIAISAAPASGYRFNKWTSTGGGTFADANSASTTFTMPADAVTIEASFTYNGGGGSSGSSTFTPKPTYKAAVSGNGIPGITLPVTVNAGAGSAKVDLGIQARDMFNGEEIAVINVPSIPGINTYTLDISAASLSGSQGEGSLTFAAEIGSITISSNMLSAIEGRKAGITIGQGDRSGLPDEIETAIGDRPLVQLTLTVDGEQTAWNNPDAPVTVSIPYTPSAAELQNPEHIVVWYIDGSGNVVSVPNGRYNSETGTVTFTTAHFSHYAVAYVTKTFDDLGSVAWAKNSIEVLASKGISKGTSEREYNPRAYITRADFLYLLIRGLGVDARVDGNFDDIGGNVHYYKEIAIAKKLGITNGTGNNKFNPDASITRQDMMVLTARALKVLKKLKEQGAASDLEKFADKPLISAYAVDSVAAVVNEGLIVGSGNNLNPLGNTTRAEAAVFIYRIYSKY
ncbi:MAG: S-layer homology domain-containing protein [Bacillota bacterium]